MTFRNAVANSLLMFVAATCVVLIVKALPQTSAVPPAASGSTTAPPTDATELSNGVSVYYFHGLARCPTCRTIEAYAQEAVQAGFAPELQSGTLQWKVVNYQAPGNEHFADEYGLVAASVVLVKRVDGKQVAWKILPEVWELHTDRTAFLNFVQSNLREFLQSSGAQAVESPPPTPAPTNSQDASLPIPE